MGEWFTKMTLYSCRVSTPLPSFTNWYVFLFFFCLLSVLSVFWLLLGSPAITKIAVVLDESILHIINIHLGRFSIMWYMRGGIMYTSVVLGGEVLNACMMVLYSWGGVDCWMIYTWYYTRLWCIIVWYIQTSWERGGAYMVGRLFVAVVPVHWWTKPSSTHGVRWYRALLHKVVSVALR